MIIRSPVVSLCLCVVVVSVRVCMSGREQGRLECLVSEYTYCERVRLKTIESSRVCPTTCVRVYACAAAKLYRGISGQATHAAQCLQLLPFGLSPIVRTGYFSLLNGPALILCSRRDSTKQRESDARSPVLSSRTRVYCWGTTRRLERHRSKRCIYSLRCCSFDWLTNCIGEW